MPAEIFCFDTRPHSFRDHFVIAIFVVVGSLVMILNLATFVHFDL